MAKNRKQYFRSIAAALALVLGLMVSSTMPPAQASGAQGSGIVPNGPVYQQLSAQWWQWTFHYPVNINPAFDETGARAQLGNQGSVFFLTGVNNASGTVTRSLRMPAGKRIFFPVLNWECSILEGNGTTEAQLRQCTIDNIATITELHASIDGVAVPDLFDYRAQSQLFTIGPLPNNNIFQLFGAPGDSSPGATTSAVSDGYWLLLEPLSAGNHTINFGGTFGAPYNFTLDITYHLIVAH